MPLIDIREHGGVFGGGGGGVERFVNVTAGLTPPPNPQLYDIWIEKDMTIGDVYFEEASSITDPNDISVIIRNKQIVPATTVKKGNKTINQPAVDTTGLKKIFDSKYLGIYADYRLVKSIVSGSSEYLKAYYYDGTQWVKFSDAYTIMDDHILFLNVRNVSGTTWTELVLFDLSTNTKVWSIDKEGYSDIRYLCYNPKEAVVFYPLTNKNKWIFVDIKTGQVYLEMNNSSPMSSNVIYVPETNLFYAAFTSGSNRIIKSIDINGNTTDIYTVYNPNYAISYLMYSEYYKMIIAVTSGTAYYYTSLDGQPLPSEATTGWYALNASLADQPMILPYEVFNAKHIFWLIDSGTAAWQYKIDFSSIGGYSSTSDGASYMAAYTYLPGTTKVAMMTGFTGTGSAKTIKIYDVANQVDYKNISEPSIFFSHFSATANRLYMAGAGGIVRVLDFEGNVIYEVNNGDLVPASSGFINVNFDERFNPNMVG